MGAALLSVSVVNLLRNASLTETDFLNPSAVLESLNETFPMERHNDMYFTAWYGVYTYSTRQLSYACAGHPPAVLVNHDRSYTTLSAEGMIVGAFPSAKYETKTVQLPQGSRLFLFSDGAYEIDRPGRPMMSYDEFVQLLANTKESTEIESIIAELKRQKGSETFADDVSLVVFKFDEADASAHNTRILLRADLSELDRLPGFLQGFCTEEKMGGELLFQLNLILEELATNVIKYGGVAEKEESCIIELSRNGPILTIRFSDFGAPFNPLDQEEVDPNKSILDRPIGGLGIHFVRKLTDSQTYVREGNRNVLTLTKLIPEKE